MTLRTSHTSLGVCEVLPRPLSLEDIEAVFTNVSKAEGQVSCRPAEPETQDPNSSRAQLTANQREPETVEGPKLPGDHRQGEGLAKGSLPRFIGLVPVVTAATSSQFPKLLRISVGRESSPLAA